ncbi:MAG: sulfotransferase family 2 domain-containing protein [Xanthomonadales bacterium]|nr:sulfotransferase family 2 domain-containing protein [Xanthomonadales bacterium]
MPVYHRSKLVHIHIPKTGGTAIERFFHSIDDMVWGKESWLGQEYLHRRWYELQHLSMLELLNFTGEFKIFYSFAVIRNPYFRLVSEFLWRQLVFQNGGPHRYFDSFEELVFALPLEIDNHWRDLIRNANQHQANFLIHVRPQHQYVCDRSGKLVVNELLRFEQFKDDFARLLKRHGLQTEMIQTPGERNIEEYYDRKMLDRVNMIYARDFSLGAYEML